MSESSRDADLPVEMKQGLAAAASAQTPLQTFHCLRAAHAVGVRALDRLGKQAKEKAGALKAAEADMAFLERHRAKEDVALRALRGTYVRPTKALAVFNDLCRNFAPHYVAEVIRLGSYRLGWPLGFGILNYRSETRIGADENYAQVVVPALDRIIPDQRDYLDLRDTGIEALHADALKAHTEVSDRRLSIEGAVRDLERDIRAAALSLSDSEVGKLDAEDYGFRMAILTPRQREAELSREAG